MIDDSTAESPDPTDADAGTGAWPANQVDPIHAAAAHWKDHGWAGGARMPASMAIHRVAALARQRVTEVLKTFDLTFSRHELLAVLYFSSHGEMSLGRISSRLFLHPTSVTATVDALEKLGFVERVPNPNDRRGVRARITPLGRERIEQSTPAIVEAESGLEAMTEDEARLVFDALTSVRRAAGDLE
ncbi:MAG: MarR family winged helix-turn-helix transcriptional regulator [Acidimicrobiales bacterium]